METKIKEFKIRCSAIGKITGNTERLTEAQTRDLNILLEKEKLTPKQEIKKAELIKKRDTEPELSKTAKTYCEVWLKEQLYNRRQEFTSKYTDKGLINEDENLDFVGNYYSIDNVVKNEERFFGDFMEGEPDFLNEEEVLDVKSPWDAFTFPLLEDEIPNDDYFGQGQGYMFLTGRKKYRLVYVLSDTPIHLVKKEVYYYAKDNGMLNETGDVPTGLLQEFVNKHSYGDIPAHLKTKEYKFEFDPAFIVMVEKQVLKCRKYIAELLKKIKH